jgi:serine/threonine-protein kinase
VFDVDRIDEPIEAFLGDSVVRRFGDRPHSVVVGVEHDGKRYVIKAATTGEADAVLRNALRVHERVAHPAIVPLLHHFETPQGIALVYPWADGEVLRDRVDPAVLPMDDEASPYRRFLALPVGQRCDAIRQVFDAHVAVAAAGLVAVDLYDGSIVYDFDRRQLRVIDIDFYRPGPYALDRERQLGSLTFMAPEELERGATIDERTTVFTLGRFGLVFLGCARHEPPRPSTFEGTAQQWDLLRAATRDDPGERLPSVAALLDGWDAAQPSTSRRNPSA